MAVLTESEPWVFPERSLRLLDQVAARIRPDDPALEEWFSKYCQEHRTRLAADLLLIEKHVAGWPEASARTVAQLLLVGYVLQWVFDPAHVLMIIPIVVVMIAVASRSAVAGAISTRSAQRARSMWWSDGRTRGLPFT